MLDNKGQSAVQKKSVKCSVLYISLVYERAVQFNTRDFIVETYIRKRLFGKCSRQFRVSFPGVSDPLKSSLFAI
jgi:hypothetical protein